jgi:hypothetical protein
MSEWYEPLPVGCPPSDATQPDGRPLYRAVKTNPATNADFVSQRTVWPMRRFNVPECIARAVSFRISYESCEHLTKLPNHLGEVVAEVILPSQSGVLKQTGKEEHHISWWRAAAFDPLPFCRVVEDQDEA